MEQRSDLKREQLKSQTYAIEKKNLKHCLLGVKQVLETTQDKLNQKQTLMSETLTRLENIKAEQVMLLGQNQQLQERVRTLEALVEQTA